MREAATTAKLGAAFLAGGLLAAGCGEKESFPDEPMIEYKSLTVNGDTAFFTISFTDGDGDVGLDAYDNKPPFDASSVYYHNLFLIHEHLDDGQWVPTTLSGTVQLNYRIPRITPTGQNKALEGDIEVKLYGWPYRPEDDTVRISAYMVDRSLNESNSVTSDAIVAE